MRAYVYVVCVRHRDSRLDKSTSATYDTTYEKSGPVQSFANFDMIFDLHKEVLMRNHMDFKWIIRGNLIEGMANC